MLSVCEGGTCTYLQQIRCEKRLVHAGLVLLKVCRQLGEHFFRHIASPIGLLTRGVRNELIRNQNSLLTKLKVPVKSKFYTQRSFEALNADSYSGGNQAFDP